MSLLGLSSPFASPFSLERILDQAAASARLSIPGIEIDTLPLFLFYTIDATCRVLFSSTVKGLLHLTSPFAMWGEMRRLLIYRRDGTSTSGKWCTLERHPRWRVLRKGKMLYSWNDVREQRWSQTLTSAGPRFCHPISRAQINGVVLNKRPVQAAFPLSVGCVLSREMPAPT